MRFEAIVNRHIIPAMRWKLINSPVTTDPVKGEIVTADHI